MARVKLGDYYYYGQGTEVNYEVAAGQYRIVSPGHVQPGLHVRAGHSY